MVREPELIGKSSPAEKRMPVRPGPLRRLQTLALVAQLVLALGGAGLSFAGEEPAAVQAPSAEPALGAEPEAEGEPEAPTDYLETFTKTMDETHDRLEQNILKQAIRFDNSFGSVRTAHLRQTSYELNLLNSLRIERGGKLEFGTSIRAKFVLSRISDRLHLFIAGDNEPGPAKPSLPSDPGRPGFDRTTPTARIVNTEFRYWLLRTPTTELFLGAGFRLRLPFEAFVRSRFQYTHNLSDISLIRFAETFFVKNTDLLGETTEITYERLLAKNMLLRWANLGTASQEIQGLEWGTELSLIRELSPKSSITLTGGIYGHSTSNALVENFRILTRYRRNFLRSWLFYELEPEISWPRGSDGKYSPTLAVIGRIEVAFRGVAARKEEVNLSR